MALWICCREDNDSVCRTGSLVAVLVMRVVCFLVVWSTFHMGLRSFTCRRSKGGLGGVKKKSSGTHITGCSAMWQWDLVILAMCRHNLELLADLGCSRFRKPRSDRARSKLKSFVCWAWGRRKVAILATTSVWFRGAICLEVKEEGQAKDIKTAWIVR